MEIKKHLKNSELAVYSVLHLFFSKQVEIGCSVGEQIRLTCSAFTWPVIQLTFLLLSVTRGPGSEKHPHEAEVKDQILI